MASDTYGVGYNSKTIEGRYNQYARNRELFLERGRDCAQYTIPTLIPDEGHTSTSRFNTPYQGIGARGVNNLASKLLLTLLHFVSSKISTKAILYRFVNRIIYKYPWIMQEL